MFEPRGCQRLSIPRAVQFAEYRKAVTLDGRREFGRRGKAASRTIRDADQQRRRSERGGRHGRYRRTADDCAFEMKRRKRVEERLFEGLASWRRLPRVDVHVDQPIGDTP